MNRSIFGPGILVTLIVLAGCAPKQPQGTTSAPPTSAPPTSAPTEPSSSPPSVATSTGSTAAAPVQQTGPNLDDPAVIRKEVDTAAALLTTGKEADARQALQILQQVEPHAPEMPEVSYDIGIAWVQLGDFNQARNAFMKATEIDPKLGEAWLNLGSLAEQSGDLQRALRYYETGLKWDPDNSELVVGVIGALRKLGQDDLAIAQARAALARNANNINVYNNLGLVYLDEGKTDLALFIYKRAMTSIDGAENNALLHANLGRVYMAQDKASLAEAEFKKALELDPDLVAAQTLMARVALDNRDYGKAAALLEKARAQRPDNAGIWIDLGIAYRGMGVYAAADGDSAKAKGYYDKAQQCYEKALELDPTNLDTYLNLAVLLGDYKKSFDEAIKMIDDYLAKGGSRKVLASKWRVELVNEQQKYQSYLKRQKELEERRKKREEEKRLAEEWEKKVQAANADQEANGANAAENGGDAGQSAEQGTMTRNGEGSGGSAAPEQLTAPAGAASGEATLPPPPAGSASGEAASKTGARSTTGSPEPAMATPSSPQAPESKRCTAIGSCGEMNLECAHDGVCRPAGSRGTYGVGVSCMAETDCAYGLVCESGLCLRPAPSNASNPWGGAQ